MAAADFFLTVALCFTNAAFLAAAAFFLAAFGDYAGFSPRPVKAFPESPRDRFSGRSPTHRAFRLSLSEKIPRLTGRLSHRGRSRPIGNLNLALENLDRNVQSLEERLSGVASSGAGWHQNFLRGTDTRSSHGRDFVGDGHIADDLDVLVGEHEAIVSNDARNEGLEVAVLLGVLADEHVDHGRQ
eukprot:859997_1